MQKNKLTTIGIVIATVILAGVAIFTAVRLYQTSKISPDKSSASGGCPAGQMPNPAAPFPGCTLAGQGPCCIPEVTPTTPGCTSNITCSTQCGLKDRDTPDGCGGIIHCGENPTCPPATTPPYCAPVLGTCLNSSNVCIGYTDGCQRAANCKTPITSCSSPRPTASSCTQKAYFDIVLTDASGNNAGTCKSTALTFDSTGLSCDGTNSTCDQYLAQLTQQSGVNKTGGCYDTLASCQTPGGKAASFRFFYNGTSCVSTNHRYWTSGTGANNDTDADDLNHRTCFTNLGLAGVAKKVCYTTKPACQADNAQPTPTTGSCTSNITCSTQCGLPYRCTADGCGGQKCCDATVACTNATPTAGPTEHPNTCLLEFTISSSTATPTATATATSTATATPTATSTATATATAIPQCNNSCTSNSNCPSGLICSSGMCRNTQCLSETDCTCNVTTATPTATSTATATATPTYIAQQPNPTETPTLPVVGTRWPTLLGTGFGILVIIGSLLLAL